MSARRRVLLSTYHSIAEHDDLSLLHEQGCEVLSLGAYLDPRNPGDDKRPALDIDPVDAAIVERCRDTHAAKQDLPGDVLEWLGRDGIIIWHHFPEMVFQQWAKLRAWGGRVIWRSCGQTSNQLEAAAGYFRNQGLERVAYSPTESAAPSYAGHDALIRFHADPAVWNGWTGDDAVVTNITQNLYERGNATHPEFWAMATMGLPTALAGAGSERYGGLGVLPFDDLRGLLRASRAYLYTGTQAAPYTLGFIEAAMTGIPIVSIGPKAWGTWYTHSPDLFEAAGLAWRSADDTGRAREYLLDLLEDEAVANEASRWQRAIALDLFDRAKVGAQWKAYLG